MQGTSTKVLLLQVLLQSLQSGTLPVTPRATVPTPYLQLVVVLFLEQASLVMGMELLKVDHQKLTWLLTKYVGLQKMVDVLMQISWQLLMLP